MDAELLETRYLKIIKRCAQVAGVWPGQRKASKYAMLIIIYVLIMSSIVTQVARIVCFFSLDILLEQVPFVSAAFGVILKQWNYIFNAKEYNALITGIRKDWLVERPKEEIDIIMMYAERAYLLILLYLATAFSCLALFLQMPLTPRILDIVWPKNESRDLGYVYPAYYAVDEHKYYPYIILHMTLGMLAVACVYIPCDTSFMYTVQHACGLLAVAGYRFKTAIGELFDAKNKASHDDIYRKVCHSIRGHQHALGVLKYLALFTVYWSMVLIKLFPSSYLRCIQSTHNTYLFIMVGLVMICFSATLVKVSNMSVCIELAKDYTFLVVQLVHLLYLSIQGQFVENSTDDFVTSVSEMLWYNGNRKTQLLILLALRCSMTPPLLDAGGLITLNFQSFAEILKASVSYFTVLKST